MIIRRLLHKRRGDDPKVFAMTLNLHDDQEPRAVRSKELLSRQNNIDETTELAILANSTPRQVSIRYSATRGQSSDDCAHPGFRIQDPYRMNYDAC